MGLRPGINCVVGDGLAEVQLGLMVGEDGEEGTKVGLTASPKVAQKPSWC